MILVFQVRKNNALAFTGNRLWEGKKCEGKEVQKKKRFLLHFSYMMSITFDTFSRSHC